MLRDSIRRKAEKTKSLYSHVIITKFPLMSLQFKLVLNYAETHASANELEIIVENAREALKLQERKIELQYREVYTAAYNKWFAEYPFDGKFEIIRLNCQGILYTFELGRIYKLDIYARWISVGVGDNNCRVEIYANGDHRGCVACGCNRFNHITNDRKNIKYLLDFAREIHDKLSGIKSGLAKERLD